MIDLSVARDVRLFDQAEMPVRIFWKSLPTQQTLHAVAFAQSHLKKRVKKG
jgi:hypothetical protein